MVGVVDEVEDDLPIKCQQLGNGGVFVVRTRVLLEHGFVEEVVDEDIAVFVGYE